MADYPGKDNHTTMVGDELRVKVSTTMPCHKPLSSERKNKNPRTASNNAHKSLTRSIRNHIDGCKTCQALGVKKP